MRGKGEKEGRLSIRERERTIELNIDRESESYLFCVPIVHPSRELLFI